LRSSPHGCHQAVSCTTAVTARATRFASEANRKNTHSSASARTHNAYTDAAPSDDKGNLSSGELLARDFKRVSFVA
jgi:hypothetical protein